MEASELAAIGAGKGKELGRRLREWTRAYLKDRTCLPTFHYRNVHKALIEDEEIRQEVQLHLQSLGKYFKAADIVEYSARPEVLERWGHEKPISERTARNWLHAMEYRYGKELKGQYVDGHERDDVVKYRQDVFLKQWMELEERMVVCDKDGKVISEPDPTLYRIVPITHDESTFYAHDQRKTRWIPLSEGPVPIRKGDGTSLMVSDFCSPDLPGGWLRSKDGTREARLFFKAGKNRDGYFDNDDILETTRNAIDLFETHFPPGSGVQALFLFDNAKTHQKRAANALSARKMPKSTRPWPPSGLKMRDGTFANGKPQTLYFPHDHTDPQKVGLFKGMEVILRERGLWPAGGLRAECEGFKCADPARKFDCCARRLLFNQPDFINQKSLLQELVESRGHKFLFYPKFHCELNFIEMCWGRAKYEYRMYGIPRNEAQQQERVRQALDSVSHTSMLRFANRSARFMNAYHQGLSGSQAAWANRKYHSHRTLPPELVAEIMRTVT
ncbi:hypothetical protein M407DRAFT_86598 [Tulasnella calospora MUT 4182]|uniref:Tc1-like transposase DDE domain-containing protein n=1 Tax=Tulasnella calospora MUT 4182 TaxID=1051891 RepID=A0A0C3Q0P5_9AGAM|nr:hypothetical protein M407DRAFT_86598 [Tulasnella calospora MUT 4182]